MQIDLSPYFSSLQQMDPILLTGKVTEMVGLLIESEGPPAAVGDSCEIDASNGRRVRAQVIGFRSGKLLSMPLEETDGIQLGDPVIARSDDSRVHVGPGLLGRVLDGFGRPIDGLGPIAGNSRYDLMAKAPGPLERANIDERLVTGVRAIDSLLPCGKGQRIGIFGGS